MKKHNNKLRTTDTTDPKFTPNLGGRPKGATSKLGRLSREAVARALEGSSWKIQQALDQLFEKDPEAYISAIAKIMNYAVPKMSSTEVIDKTPKKVELNLSENTSADDLKKMLNDMSEDEDE